MKEDKKRSKLIQKVIRGNLMYLIISTSTLRENTWMISRNQQILSYQTTKYQVSFILLLKIYLKSLHECIGLVDIMTLVIRKGSDKLIKTKVIYQILMAVKKIPSQLKMYLYVVTRVRVSRWCWARYESKWHIWAIWIILGRR